MIDYERLINGCNEILQHIIPGLDIRELALIFLGAALIFTSVSDAMEDAKVGKTAVRK